MTLRYLELDNISHLNQIYNYPKNGINGSKLWRESYYFNMTDPRSGYSLISTIGILPNRKLITGFFLIIKNKRIIKLKPLIKRKKPVFNDYLFEVNGLEYIIEGPYWIIKYCSKELKFEIRFEPINRIYPYITSKSDSILNSVGSQHYEQFGEYSGEFVFGNDRVKIGPCLGHRDHSWGIRDWSVMDKYRLFCCAFSKEFGFNLWEGWINNKKFLKGYVFDGSNNTKIVKSNVRTRFESNCKKPKDVNLFFLDELGRKYDIKSSTQFSIPVPPRNSILFENLAKMKYKNHRGNGLSEYLFHEPNMVHRLWIFLKLLTYL
jgi:hypothetical protein